MLFYAVINFLAIAIIYIMVRSRRIFIFTLGGAVFTLVLGSLGHFVYEWSGGAEWAAWLFPVNESVWEHLKLLILPVVLYFAAGAYFVRGADNYLSALFFCLVVSAGFVTGGFYLYFSIVRDSILILDIALFAAGTFLGWRAAYYLLTSERYALLSVISLIGVVVILTCFFLFTFHPPHTFLFRAPGGGFGR